MPSEPETIDAFSRNSTPDPVDDKSVKTETKKTDDGKDASTITINPTEAGNEYIVVPKGTDPSNYDWTNAKKSESGESITIGKDHSGKDLVPGEDYEIVTRKASTTPGKESEPAKPTPVTTTPAQIGEDSVVTTPTTLTVKDPQPNTQYEVKDDKGNTVATVTIDKDGKIVEPVSTEDGVKVEKDKDGNIKISGLEPEKEYGVTAAKTDENGTPKSNPSEPVVKKTPELIAEKTPATPDASSKSDGSVEIGKSDNGTSYIFDDGKGGKTTVAIDKDGNVTVEPEGSSITAAVISTGALVVKGLAEDAIYEVTAVTASTSPDNKDSDPSEPIKIRTAKSAPDTPVQGKLVGAAGNDGTIKGVDDTMEYSTDGGKTWTSVPAGQTEITGLGAGDVQVRYKAKPAADGVPAQPASEPKTVSVEKKNSDGQTAINADDIKTDATTSSISVKAPVTEQGKLPVYEYSIDGGKTWQTSPVFTKDGSGKALEAGKTYELQVRKAEDDNSMASPATSFSVSMVPEPPEQETKDTNSITVDPTTKGLEYIVVPKSKVDNVTEDDWKNSKLSENGEALTFGNLIPGEEYVVITRTPAVVDESGNEITAASEPSEPVSVYTQTEEPEAESNARTVTVKADPEDGQEYIIVPKGKTPTDEDWANALTPGAGDDSVIFTRLSSGEDGRLVASTEYDVYTRKIGKPETMSDAESVTTDPTGRYIPKVDTEKSVIDVEAEKFGTDLVQALCTKDEVERVLDGEDARLFLEVSTKDEDITDSDKPIAEKFAATIEGGVTIGAYLDVSLFKQIGDDDPNAVHDTKGRMVRITITIPEELRNTNSNVERTFYIIRVHDGEASLLATTTDEKVLIETDKFSTYAIAYNDKDITTAEVTTPTETKLAETPAPAEPEQVTEPEEPDEVVIEEELEDDEDEPVEETPVTTKKTTGKSVATGDTNSVYAWMGIFIAGLAAMLVLVVYRRRRDN